MPPPRRKLKLNEYKCPYCPRTFDTEEGVNRHISHMPACMQKQHEATSRILANYKSEYGNLLDPGDRDEDLPIELVNFFELPDTGEDYLDDQFPNPPTMNNSTPSDGDSDSDDRKDGSNEEASEEADLLNAGPILETNQTEPFVEHFLGAAEVLGRHRSKFEQRLAEEKCNGVKGIRLHDELHHELARWMMSAGLSQAKIDEFLKLKLVCDGPFLYSTSNQEPRLVTPI